MRRASRSQPPEPTIALINIVFLMLVFFLVAGTVARVPDKDVTLVHTKDLDRVPPVDALVAHADGRLTHLGTPVSGAEAYMSGLDAQARAVVRIVPDRALPAARLVALGRDLRAAGAGRVVLVTEQALK